jgi:3',5'-cyclic AMP phosphodiesterase CpdA
MARILHISDVHVQVDYGHRPWRRMGWRRVLAQVEYGLLRRSRRYANARDTLERIAGEVTRRKIDHVVLSGDLTGLALDEEFQGVQEGLGALAQRKDLLTVVPGNHDVFTPGSQRSRRFEKWFGHLLDTDLPGTRAEGAWPMVRLVGDALAIVGLCSARVPLMPGHAAGWVGDEQLGALQRIVRHPRMKGRIIYAVLHHAPMRRDGGPDRLGHGLTDARRVLDACRLAGVAAILCGHLHMSFHVPRAEGPAVVCGGSSTWKGHEGFMVLEDQAGRLSSVEEVKLVPEAVPVPVVVPGSVRLA